MSKGAVILEGLAFLLLSPWWYWTYVIGFTNCVPLLPGLIFTGIRQNGSMSQRAWQVCSDGIVCLSATKAN